MQSFWQKMTRRNTNVVWTILIATLTTGLILLRLATPDQSNPPASNSLVTPAVIPATSSEITTDTRTVTSSIDVSGYTIIFTRTGDERYIDQASKITILRKDKVVFETKQEQDFSGFYAGEIGEYIENADDIKNEALKDINGDGSPELIISGYSGGSHCCSHPYVIELTNPLSFLFDRETSDYDIDFKDLNHDGVMEIETYEPVFIYWHTSYAASPAPNVVLSLKNGKYKADPLWMRKPAPTEDQIQKKAKAIESWSGAAGPDVAWKYALDLIYNGNTKAALRYIDLAWRNNGDGDWKTKEMFLSELEAQIKQSVYFNDLQSYFDLGSLSVR